MLTDQTASDNFNHGRGITRVDRSGPSSFRVENNRSRFLVALGQTGGSRLPVVHPKGLALTRPAAPQRSPKRCRPMGFWPTTLTAEGDSPPSRWREGGEG